jgi:hypothetical protein
MGFTTVALFALQMLAGGLAAGLVVIGAGGLLACGVRALPGRMAPALGRVGDAMRQGGCGTRPPRPWQRECDPDAWRVQSRFHD